MTVPKTSEGTVKPRAIRLALQVGLVLVMLALGCTSFRMQSVEDDQMSPTLQPGDVVVVNRFAFTGRLPYRGELVVIAEGGVDRILRVIGIGGDTIEIKNGSVLIGGKAATEPYRSAGSGGKVPAGKWRVPGGDVFLLGDQREGAVDSRRFGCVDIERLRGLAVFRLYPSARRGWL